MKGINELWIGFANNEETKEEMEDELYFYLREYIHGKQKDVRVRVFILMKVDSILKKILDNKPFDISMLFFFT